MAFSGCSPNKLERRGGKLIKVDPKNTSRTCPLCGLVSAENRKTQASFACVACGYRANADLVGAINVLRAGRARLACGMSGGVRPLSAGTQRDLLQHWATAAAEVVWNPRHLWPGGRQYLLWQ